MLSVVNVSAKYVLMHCPADWTGMIDGARRDDALAALRGNPDFAPIGDAVAPRVRPAAAKRQ